MVFQRRRDSLVFTLLGWLRFDQSSRPQQRCFVSVPCRYDFISGLVNHVLAALQPFSATLEICSEVSGYAHPGLPWRYVSGALC